jgi:hypothetical protein
MQMILFAIISVHFNIRDQLSTTDSIFCICQILQKKWEYNQAVHQLFTDFKKPYNPLSREVSYNILIAFSMCMGLERLITMCLHETYTKASIGNHLSDTSPVKNG